MWWPTSSGEENLTSCCVGYGLIYYALRAGPSLKVKQWDKWIIIQCDRYVVLGDHMLGFNKVVKVPTLQLLLNFLIKKMCYSSLYSIITRFMKRKIKIQKNKRTLTVESTEKGLQSAIFSQNICYTNYSCIAPNSALNVQSFGNRYCKHTFTESISIQCLL